MKIKWKTLLICIAIPLLVGGISGLVSGGGMSDFALVNKPPLSPPGWLFPVAWTVLYTLMGIASYLVLTADVPIEDKLSALKTYGFQLFLNFFWSIWFFNFNFYYFSYAWILALLIAIVVTTVQFWQISKVAGLLMIPYILWVSFASYLNLGIAILN